MYPHMCCCVLVAKEVAISSRTSKAPVLPISSVSEYHFKYVTASKTTRSLRIMRKWASHSGHCMLGLTWHRIIKVFLWRQYIKLLVVILGFFMCHIYWLETEQVFVLYTETTAPWFYRVLVNTWPVSLWTSPGLIVLCKTDVLKASLI